MGFGVTVKKYTIIIIYLMLEVQAALGQANRTDLSELKIKMVFFNRESFIKPCLLSPSPCGLSASDIKSVNDVLIKSMQILSLDVTSATENPLLFKKDYKGQYPLYTFENGRILLNRDRLLDASFKSGAPFEVFVDSMLSYLFFQQFQKLEPSQLLSKKIALFWGKLFKSIGLNEFKEDKIELLVFKNTEVRILLLDSYQAYVLNPELLKSLKCDDSFLASLITNYSTITWTKYQAGALGSKAGMRALLAYQCVNGKGDKQNWTGDLSADFEFQGAEKKRWNSANLLVKVNGSKKEAR